MKMGLLLFLTILGMFGISVTANVIDNTSMKSHNDHAGGSIEDMKSHHNVNESLGNFFDIHNLKFENICFKVAKSQKPPCF